MNILENTPKNAKNNYLPKSKEWQIPKYKLGKGPVFTFNFTGGEIHTPATRQLCYCHWSGAFQTWTATSSFDGVTHNNRYDSENAGRSQRALSISTQ